MPSHDELKEQFRRTWQYRLIHAAGDNTPVAMALRSAFYGPEIEMAAGAYPLALKGDIIRHDDGFKVAIACLETPIDGFVAHAPLDRFQELLERAMVAANLTGDERTLLDATLRTWWQYDERDPDQARAAGIRAKMPKVGAHQWNPKTQEWDEIARPAATSEDAAPTP